MTKTPISDRGADWGTFAMANPSMARRGAELLSWTGEAAGLIATVRGDGPPRIHPVNVGIVDGGLYAFFLGSPKRTDLEDDGRYALHAHQDPAEPAEFSVRGRAIAVSDPAVRSVVAATWPFTVTEDFTLFELRIASALLGERAADEWPPRYTSWAVGAAGKPA